MTRGNNETNALFSFVQAGVASGKASITALTDDEWDQMMHINTTSCFLAVKYAAPAMMKTSEDANGSIEGRTSKEDANGSIILTASVAGLRSGAGPIHCESARSSSVLKAGIA
jgi:NAD(P)-dependent dehydrogenase (short-subunit alcohol dehydrogenase family)